MKNNKNIREVVFYSIIAFILITISILNNVFWKVGKNEEKTTEVEEKQEEVQQLKTNNITYDVPFDEKWLD